MRFPYLFSLTDIDDFLYTTADVAIWSTVETGLGITAAAVATMRPLLKLFTGGDSEAPGHGTSARQWQRTGSGYAKGDDAFDLHDVTAQQRFGVTTVIDYGPRGQSGGGPDGDVEGQRHPSKGDNSSDASGSVTGRDEWNTSQSNLADKLDDGRLGPNSAAWNITVKKSIVQTRD